MPTASPAILDYLLGTANVTDFCDTVLGNNFLYVPGDNAKFSGLFSWASLNSVLQTGRLSYPDVILVQQGQEVPESQYSRKHHFRPRDVSSRLDSLKIEEYLDAGATLVVRHVDESWISIQNLSEALEMVFACRVQVNAYVSQSDKPGLNVHADDHDVFVLQIEGRKRWRLYRQEDVQGKTRSSSPKVEQDIPVLDVVLRKGDLLYVPKGCWHLVSPVSEPTVHLTVGIYRLTGLDLLKWVYAHLERNGRFHKAIPLFRSSDEDNRYLADLSQAACELLARVSYDKLLQDCQQMLPPRPHFRLHGSANNACD